MVDRRVEMTMKYSISRSVDDADFRRTFELYVKAGQDLANAIEPNQEQGLAL